MIELFLDKHKVLISSEQHIKLNRENPFISSSGDYTLDVDVPMSIVENRKFFGPLYRLEKKKDIKIYAARLLVDNICIVNGSAKVISIDESKIKLQLYGDRSEFNAVFGNKYIDELNLPYFYKSDNGGYGGKRNINTRSDGIYSKAGEPAPMPEERWDTFIYASIYNEEADKVINIHTAMKKHDGSHIPYFPKNRQREAQFNLFFVIRSIFSSIGYRIDMGVYDREPYNHIYIASCISSKQMVHALPHWTLKTFVEQLQYLFGCRFLFSSTELTIAMVPNFGTTDDAVDEVAIIPVNDYNVDIDDDDNLEGLFSSNLHYNLSDSEYHDIDYFDDIKLDNLPTKSFGSLRELFSGYESMSPEEREKYIFRCPQGDYALWCYNSPSNTDDKTTRFIHINHFGDVKRNDSDNTFDMKICPVAMAEAIPVHTYAERKGNHGSSAVEQQTSIFLTMPSMTGRSEDDKGRFKGGKTSEEIIILESTVIQDMIENDTTPTNYSKPDRIEIFFWDEKYLSASEFEYGGRTVDVRAPATFTAYDLKDIRGVNHRHWSLSLKEAGGDIVTMQKYRNKFRINQKQKYCIKFISETLPDASNIFIINNKKFIAEMIEIDFKDGKMSKLMNGFFYEII